LLPTCYAGEKIEFVARTGGAVAKISFVDLKSEFDEACEFLRCFTLGQRGFTQQDGVAGVQRVSDLCDRLKVLFASGPHASEAVTIVASGRTRIAAANARLALLRGRNRAGKDGP
jgi:hypothetical protein